MKKEKDDKLTTFTEKERRLYRSMRLERVIAKYKCSRESAQIFIDLRDEGHPVHQAALMAGLADPLY